MSGRSFGVQVLAIALAYQLGYWGLFAALQQPDFYSWLAPARGMSYQAQGEGQRRIVHEPFRAIHWDYLAHWDGEHYHRIRLQGYRCPDGTDCLSPHQAFFPLAPWLWALFRLGPGATLVFNWSCFAAGWAALVWGLRRGGRASLLIFGAGLLLPHAYVFMFPYSEGVYFGCGALALVGLLRRQYGLYFVGACLAAMARPTLFLLLPALAGAVFLAWLRERRLRLALGQLVRMAAPLIVGTTVVVLVQYAATGRWFLFYQAHHQFWKREIGWPLHISDWSHEGYGLTLSALGLVGLVGGVLFFHRLAQAHYHKKLALGPTTPTDLLIDWALLAALASVVFVVATQGGSLASLSRYLVATPFTYALSLAVVPWAGCKRLVNLLPWGLALMLVLFERIDYGGFSLLRPASLFYVPLLGGGLTVGLAAWGAGMALRPGWGWWAVGVLLVPVLLFWQVYLLNCLLCNGWIAT